MIEGIFFEVLGDFIEDFERMDKFDVELMGLGFDVTVEGGDGIEESNDWLEVGLH